MFSDIDGTLLDSEHRISPLTRQAIDELQAAGIPFVIVTARGITGTYPLLDQHGLSCPVVTYGGGVILDEDRRIIHHAGMSRAVAQQVIDFVEQQGYDLSWNAYSFEDWVVKDRTDPRIQEEESIVMSCAREGDARSFEVDEVQKILCLCADDAVDEIERGLRERFCDLSVVKSAYTHVEVMPRDVSKGSALLALCKLWDIDPAGAVAFGDSDNDIPMLQAAGEGFLMGNAQPALLDAYPQHARDNDHDGIYWALRGLGLCS